MKKKLNLLGIMLILAAMLAGCGDKNVEFAQKLKVEDYVTLGEYKGLQVTGPSLEVTDEDFELSAREFYNQYITKDEGGVIEGTVKNGDYVNIDFEGKKDGVAFDGGTSQGYALGIGTNEFIDGFEEGLIGVQVGETVDLNLAFPEDYGKDELNGQEVVFTVTVNFIYPDYKDEVVASWGVDAFTNVQEFKDYVQVYLETMAQTNYDYIVENSVLSKFMNNCTFLKDVPEGMISKYRVRLNENIEAEASYYGFDAESYCQIAFGMSLSQYLDNSAVETAKQMIAMVALAKQEGLMKEGADLDAAIQQAATDAGYTDVKEFMGENTSDAYAEVFAFEDALKFLVDNAVVTTE